MKKAFPKNPRRKTSVPAFQKATPTVARVDVTFAGLLKTIIPEPSRSVAPPTLQSSPLAHLDYSEELKIKNEGLGMFWQRYRLPGQPEPVVPSPKPRAYRTTSKRRAILRGSTLFLIFGDKALSAQKKPFLPSPLEPPEHAEIYTFLQRRISEPSFRLVGTHLNYIIIRGSYTERAVIFNVDTMNGPLVRKLKILATHLQALAVPVCGAYVYPDPTSSDYFLEERRPADLLHFKKLFGKPYLSVTFGDCRYSFHPTSFSQVNESIVPSMLDKASELLAPAGSEQLLDLYCGYGLFSHFLAPHYKQVIGVDAEGPAIREAMAIKKRRPGSRNTRFIARRITAASMEEVLPESDLFPEAILLDPPRQGPQEGVIAVLARRKPQRVLHIHCGVDQIPLSAKAWKQNGYKVRRVVPLDMFPGSANLEVLVLLEPNQSK